MFRRGHNNICPQQQAWRESAAPLKCETKDTHKVMEHCTLGCGCKLLKLSFVRLLNEGQVTILREVAHRRAISRASAENLKRRVRRVPRRGVDVAERQHGRRQVTIHDAT